MTRIKTSNLNIRTTPEELEQWTQAARADGRPLSQWVRWVLNQAAAPKQADSEQ